MDEEGIIAVATRLFAELGYDETTLSLIAGAANVQSADITALFGGKQGLYQAVMRRVDAAESDLLRAAFVSFAPTAEACKRVADAYLDLMAENPHIPMLWMHRWMGDASDSPEMEEGYTRPLVDDIAAQISPLLPPGVDARYFVWTIVWCVFGYLTGGVLERPRVDRVVRPAELAKFRTYLHWMIDRMLIDQPSPR
ncbi:TetR/AcrR family transcriptional regulator [Nonomuraea sp. NBC_01738]|uniref:TetR/AcrR family transcriptional regulator n=1 Tax=Nonomuraea sp. NBC_01738 TaxID=2976003 RepID=UPI002E1467FA|nr:TetR/AcrR family transcriptional regulator [Nonomuraea sp. NBC_01738]